MQKRTRGGTWLRHIAVATLYCIVVSVFRHLSISNWLILSGVHLSVLLLTRYRYWPALMIGEAVSLAQLSLLCADQMGVLWALINVVPSTLLIAPIVYWVRERGRLYVTPHGVNMSAVLLASLLVSFVRTLNSLSLTLLMKTPAGYPQIHYGELASRWMLGNYLGALTIVPLILFLHQEVAHSSWNDIRRKIAQSRLLLDSGCVLLPLLGVLAWFGFHAEADSQIRQVIQICMFLPVVWLALRHGWQGAAIGGTGASLTVIALMPHRYDVNTLQAEVVIAFITSTMLLMGARIALLDRSVTNERNRMRSALALAQRNAQLGETQLRTTSQTLEQIGLAVHSVCTVMSSRQGAVQPAFDVRSYQGIALNAKDQLFGLADSLYPVAWQEKGLVSALREGQIPRTLDNAGLRYWCDVRGPLTALSPALQLAIYRLVCDVIADICSLKRTTAFGVHLRCGAQQGRFWVVLRLVCHTDQASIADIRWDRLFPNILPAGSGRGFQFIQDCAATFEGKARERSLPKGHLVSVMLLDPEKPSVGQLH